MSDDKKDKPKDKNGDTPEEDRTFVEGVVDGFVETIINPFKWVKSVFEIFGK